MTIFDNIIDVSESNFDQLVIEFSYQSPVVVDFWAEWCNPCKMLTPLLERLTQEASGMFRLAKVNVDNNQNLALRFGVHGIPATKGIRNGNVVAEFVGMQPESRIREFIRKISPGKYDLLIEKGNSLLINEAWDEAQKIFIEIIKEDPQNTPGLLGLSKCHIATGNFLGAVNILENFPPSKEYRSATTLLPLAHALQGHNSNLRYDSNLMPAYSNALNLIKRGNIPAAMDGLLDILRAEKNFLGGSPRMILLGLFDLLGDEKEITRQYRQELASILF